MQIDFCLLKRHVQTASGLQVGVGEGGCSWLLTAVTCIHLQY